MGPSALVHMESLSKIENPLMCLKNVHVHVEEPDWTIGQRLIII